LALIASPDGHDGSVMIHQDAYVYATRLDGNESVTHRVEPGRRAYVHVARGKVRVNGKPLAAGDAAKISEESVVTLDAGDHAEVLVFDLP